MSKLMKDIGEVWSAEQKQLFQQVIEKHVPEEEQYQASMQQKINELQEKADNLAKQESEGSKIETPTVDNPGLVNQLNQLKEQTKSLTNEAQEKSKRLQSLQTEKIEIDKKISKEQTIINRVKSLNESHEDQARDQGQDNIDAQLGGATHEGE